MRVVGPRERCPCAVRVLPNHRNMLPYTHDSEPKPLQRFHHLLPRGTDGELCHLHRYGALGNKHFL